MVSGFTGFGSDLVGFFADLEDHNDRDWFRANKDRYELNVAAPLKALAVELEPLYGPVRIFRPYRDVRFSADKRPIQEHARMGAGGAGPGLFLQVDADGLFLAGGYWHAERDVLDRFRRFVDQPESAAALHRRLSALAEKGYDLQEPSLKGPPRGYRQDHPELALLRVTNLVVGAHHGTPSWLSTPEARDRIREGWDVISGWNGWLKAELLPS